MQITYGRRSENHKAFVA